MPVDSPSPRFWPWAVLWAALFALAHTQSPAYFSNQHQYYLHGLAQANVGLLNEDWLANTRDPTPVYSAMVAAIYKLAGPIGFHVLYFVLLGTYFESLRRLVAPLPGFPDRGPPRLVFLTLLLASHAAILRVASVRLTGVDYPWFLQAGLAAQYLLGPGLQPSVFGVLLVVSLAAFVNQRPILAAAFAAGAAVMHSTYLLPAGLMTLGYFVVLWREGKLRIGLAASALALAMVIPVIAFNARVFLDGGWQLAEAQRIFAKVRIPHHTVFNHWFDWVAGVQLAIMGIGLVLVRRTRLFLALLVPTLGCTLLAIIQVLTASNALALLFPWRFSTVLVPVSVALIFGRLAILVAGSHVIKPFSAWTGGIVAVGLAMAGIAVMALGLGYFTNEAELSLLDYVREHKQPGEVYLLPVKFPTLKKESPASQSKTFAPPVRTGSVGIPVDLQRFRLYTGAPIYIDFKSPPYAADEVLEWHARMSNAERWYAQGDWDSTGIVQELRAAGITHVVVAADKDVRSASLEFVFGDETYRLYRIKR